MSFIDTSINVLKLLIKPRKIAPNEIPQMLESIHGALLAMSKKEAELSPKQTTAEKPTHEAFSDTKADPPQQRTDITGGQPISDGNATVSASETLEGKPTSLQAVTQKISTEADSAVITQPVAIQSSGDSSDAIVCQICGQAWKILIPHLRKEHQMDEQTYRRQFNIPESQRLTAPSLILKRKNSRAAASAKSPVKEKVEALVSASESSESPVKSPANKMGITDDAITCLVCGKTMKRLITHIKSEHEMSEAAYRREFKIPKSVPLVAPSLSRTLAENQRARSATARLAKGEEVESLSKSVQTGEILKNVASTEPNATSNDSTIGADDSVIKCLICGFAGKKLRSHLEKEHKITEATYRNQFNIPGSVSLIAPALSRQLGEKTRARYAAARMAKETQKSDQGVDDGANSVTA